jgi:hypothetical protein
MLAVEPGKEKAGPQTDRMDMSSKLGMDGNQASY